MIDDKVNHFIMIAIVILPSELWTLVITHSYLQYASTQQCTPDPGISMNTNNVITEMIGKLFYIINIIKDRIV